jgi:hypothetical protein
MLQVFNHSCRPATSISTYHQSSLFSPSKTQLPITRTRTISQYALLHYYFTCRYSRRQFTRRQWSKMRKHRAPSTQRQTSWKLLKRLANMCKAAAVPAPPVIPASSTVMKDLNFFLGLDGPLYQFPILASKRIYSGGKSRSLNTVSAFAYEFWD